MANGKYGQYCIVLSDQNSVISVNSPETEQSDRVGRYITVSYTHLADHKAEHGKLVHTFGRGISINPL